MPPTLRRPPLLYSTWPAAGAIGGARERRPVRQGLLPEITRLVIGVAAALALGRVLSSVLYGVGPAPPLPFPLVPRVLIGVAGAAAYIRARAASRLDPMAALRSE